MTEPRRELVMCASCGAKYDGTTTRHDCLFGGEPGPAPAGLLRAESVFVANPAVMALNRKDRMAVVAAFQDALVATGDSGGPLDVERVRALQPPPKYENDENGNWWTTDMDYGWDMAIEAVARLSSEEADREGVPEGDLG